MRNVKTACHSSAAVLVPPVT